MPELPEVETVLRGLAPVIEGQKITKATATMTQNLNGM
ncbi:MAG: DNA-formamidopyrimidine glycosylase family protein, partial [Paracoccaceae bacterium]